MKIGWCESLQNASLLRELGYDFVELPLAPMGLEARETFEAAKREVQNSPLPPLAFNVFFPRDLRVVGPVVDVGRVRNYLARAAELLATAKAQVVVLGSGWARNVPDGWERARAEGQWVQALSWCADALRGTGTTLVIEPLNRKESNLVNSVAEGVRFAKQVDRPEILVLADFYHMDEEQEPLATLTEHAAWLAHIHLADTGRRNPGTGSYDYDRFFGCLKEIGYAGMISAECKVEQPETDMRHSLAFLRRHWPADGAGD
jgi:sugar phosphate isomerase/epimerase